MTRHTQKWMSWIGAGVIVLAGAAGCSHSDENHPGQAVGNMANATVHQADRAAHTVARAANRAMPAVSQAGRAAVTTPTVKAAIMANAGMRGSTIDVDTLSGNRVALRGRVHSAQQKALAGRIAKQNAPSMRIINQLQIRH